MNFVHHRGTESADYHCRALLGQHGRDARAHTLLQRSTNLANILCGSIEMNRPRLHASTSPF